MILEIIENANDGFASVPDQEIIHKIPLPLLILIPKNAKIWFYSMKFEVKTIEFKKNCKTEFTFVFFPYQKIELEINQ